ncbi:MAG: MarR family transcriptional regulator, partial [Boseongicola sp.]
QWQAQTARRSTGLMLTFAERGVIETLVREGAQSVPGIARKRLVSRQHIQKLVDELARRRLVELLPNPAHKTSPLVDATIDGERAYTVAASGEADILNAIAPRLATANLGAAVAALRSLAEALKAAK